MFFNTKEPHFLTRYFLGGAAILCMLLVNLFFFNVFPDYIPMSLFISSVVVAAWMGGTGPGIFATFLGLVAENTFFTPVEFAFFNMDQKEIIRSLVYLSQGMALSIIIGKLRKNKDAADRIKSLFLANMSHEIRTPLTSLLGYTELLKRVDLSREKQLKFLEVIEKSGNTLTKIVNDILDISKLEAGHLRIERKAFSLIKLLDEIKAFLELKCAEKSLELEFVQLGPIPELVSTDPHRLQQILLNLLGNAIKFTKEGHIKMEYGVYDKVLVFIIEDSGIGITPKQQNGLFENFYQGDSSITREFGGTGLGLALSRQLATILGGELVLVSSSPGKGSIFRVSVTYDEVIEVEQKSGELLFVRGTNPAFKGKSVLLVDDSEDNQYLFYEILSDAGFDVRVSSNGAEALTEVEKHHFDLILMDMQMPVMDGYVATRALREAQVKTPIIALTANAMTEDKEECLSVGCSDYLSKPIQMNVMMDVLSRNLGTTEGCILSADN